jgi:hypothetical protein
MARFCLRISDEITEQIHRAVTERGLQSASAFIRQAISNGLRQDVSALTEAEERIAVSFERLSKDVCRIQKAQLAMYLLIDSFVRLFLLRVPEPPGDEFQPAKTRAAARYNNFLRNVARNVTRNSQVELKELLDL